jgi:type IV secretion system protein TrbC
MNTTTRTLSAFPTSVQRNPLVAAFLLLIVLFALAPTSAHAESFDVPFISEFGCSVVQWLKGPLAILIFILVAVATMVIGMIAKMDWGKIIALCVLFGLVISFPSIVSKSSYIMNVTGMNACLM